MITLVLDWEALVLVWEGVSLRVRGLLEALPRLAR